MITRRKFLALSALGLPTALSAQAAWLEPTALRVNSLVVRPGGTIGFVHFTDFHYKGDVDYAAQVIRTINQLAPPFVCFSGDLVERARFLPAALEFIRQIKAPVYGVPGNHDYLIHAPFSEYQEAFAATGGDWIVDRSVVLPGYDLEITGIALTSLVALGPPQAKRRLLLVHYPVMADRLQEHTFDLILAGHSHGGQIRLPLVGPLVLPEGVGDYDLGLFQTKGGPLYVGSGVGTYHYPLRLNCPPEVTVVTM